MREPIGVYLLVKAGKVVYVGQSVSVYRRIAEHSKKGKPKAWSPAAGFDFRKVPYDQVWVRWCVKSELNDLEASYITAFQPEYNISRYQPATARPNLEALAAAAGMDLLWMETPHVVSNKSWRSLTRRRIAA